MLSREHNKSTVKDHSKLGFLRYEKENLHRTIQYSSFVVKSALQIKSKKSLAIDCYFC